MENEFICGENVCGGRGGDGQVKENGSCLKFEKYLGKPIKDHCHLLTTKALDWIAWMRNGINQLGFVIFARIHPDYYSVNHLRILSEKLYIHSFSLSLCIYIISVICRFLCKLYYFHLIWYLSLHLLHYSVSTSCHIII